MGRDRLAAHTKAVIDKGAKTRTFAIDTAIRSFAESGYDGTSFQNIANICGISQSVLLYHFKNKFGLFAAAVEKIESHKLILRKDVAEAHGSKNGQFGEIYELLRSELSYAYLFRAESQVLLLLNYFAAFDNHFAEIYDTYRKKWENALEQALIKGVETGLVQKPASREGLIKILHEYTLGAVTDLLSGHHEAQSMQSLNNRLIYLLECLLL